MNKYLRRDFLKGLATVPFLVYFAFSFKGNITKEISKKNVNYPKTLGIEHFEAPEAKLRPPT